MDTQARKSLGRSFPRIEDAALLTGRGRFIDDLPVGPATSHAAILRSPHPHAAIEEIDIREALAIPGVLAVITGADLVPVTGTLVAMAEKKGVDLPDLSLAEMQSVNPAITEDIFRVLGVHNSVASRQSYGGTAPDQVRAQIARWKQVLG